MQTILIIDDDHDIANLIAFNLEKRQYQTIIANDGEEGLKTATKTLPDLIVLDLMLPKMNGVLVLKKLHSNPATEHIPVIMLTARAQQEDRIAGLELGADDYLTKPFSPKELALRISAILKRSSFKKESSNTSSQPTTFGPFRFHQAALKFYINDKPINLTSTEFKLMLIFCENNNIIQDRHTLLQEIWGYGDHVNSRTLDTHLQRLRQKLGEYAPLIETIRGKGYKLTLPQN